MQTVLKLIENDINNLPFGFMYGRDSDNSPLLKMLCPNLLKIGRINTRSLDGPVRLPNGAGEIMEKIENTYDGFYKVWNSVTVPKLLKQLKWFDTKEELKVGDIVYFQKTEKAIDSKWMLGRIDTVTKGTDENVRRVEIKYQNAGENEPRFTDRAARTVIKLFHVDDTTWQDDLAEVDRIKNQLDKDDEKERILMTKMNSTEHIGGESMKQRNRLKSVSCYGDVVPLKRLQGVQRNPKAKALKKAKYLVPCNNCCCFSHCSLACHSQDEAESSRMEWEPVPHDFITLLDSSWNTWEEYEEEITCLGPRNKDLTDVLSVVNTELDDQIGLEILCGHQPNVG